MVLNLEALNCDSVGAKVEEIVFKAKFFSGIVALAIVLLSFAAVK